MYLKNIRVTKYKVHLIITKFMFTISVRFCSKSAAILITSFYPVSIGSCDTNIEARERDRSFLNDTNYIAAIIGIVTFASDDDDSDGDGKVSPHISGNSFAAFTCGSHSSSFSKLAETKFRCFAVAPSIIRFRAADM